MDYVSLRHEFELIHVERGHTKHVKTSGENTNETKNATTANGSDSNKQKNTIIPTSCTTIASGGEKSNK